MITRRFGVVQMMQLVSVRNGYTHRSTDFLFLAEQTLGIILIYNLRWRGGISTSQAGARGWQDIWGCTFKVSELVRQTYWEGIGSKLHEWYGSGLDLIASNCRETA